MSEFMSLFLVEVLRKESDSQDPDFFPETIRDIVNVLKESMKSMPSTTKGYRSKQLEVCELHKKYLWEASCRHH